MNVTEAIAYWREKAAEASRRIDAAYDELDAAQEEFALANDAIRVLMKEDDDENPV